jgi:hypothetical protein
MDKETLRMQMLSGIITESEYKAKLEENAASNLELKSLAKQLYLGFKKLGAAPKLLTTKMEIGKKGSWEDGVNITIFSGEDTISVNINSKGIGVPKAEGIKNNIEKSFPKAIFTPVNGGKDWEGNPIISFNITPGKDMSESLNESMIGGIVGIGAINQIPSRVKADYEDAFEYFLSQKYSLNEADEATAVGEKVEAAVEDKLETTVDNLSDEQKDQLRDELAKAGITANSRIEDVAGKLDESLTEAEGDTKTKVANALSNIGGGLMKSMFVPLIPLIVGYTTGAGFGGGLAITAGVAGALIGLAKLLEAEKSMKEGKEVEELDLYEAESPTKEEIAAFEAAVEQLMDMTGMSLEDATMAIGRAANAKTK